MSDLSHNSEIININLLVLAFEDRLQNDVNIFYFKIYLI